jgi:hypothetical protein
VLSDAIITAIVINIPTTIAAIGSLVVAISNKKAIGELHIAVNSRLTELLEQTAKASRAEGVMSKDAKMDSAPC